MTLNKKITLAAAGAIAVGAGLFFPATIAAQSDTTTEDTFISKLADKLGISTDEVQSAASEVRTEMRTERQAEVEAAVATAVSNGTLTQRQADILNAIPTAMEELRSSEDKIALDSEREAMKNLTQDERQAKMEEMRTAREQALVDQLNADGLNTTLDEVTTARGAARDADIMPMGGRGMMVRGEPGMMF